MASNAAELAASLASQGAKRDPARMRAVFEAYLASWRDGDQDARAALFAPDAAVEDPVGSPAHRGIAAVRAFWSMAESGGYAFDPRLELFVPGGSECLVRFVMRMARAGEPAVDLTIHEVVAFDEQCRIIALRAFWAPESIAPAPS